MATFTSTQNGNWSSSSTWGGAGVPGNGDYVTVAHQVVIDQNIGTTGAGNGVKRISISGASVSAAVLSFDAAANRTIFFADTGASAIGTGTTTAPGTDATYQGIYIGVGTLNIVGTASAVLRMEPADSTGFFYISHPSGGLGSSNVAPNLTMKYCYLKRLGQAVTNFDGIYFDLINLSASTASVITVEHCEFESPYQIFGSLSNHATAEETVSYKFNTVWNSRAQKTFNVTQSTRPNRNYTIEDNTEYDSSYTGTPGYFFSFTGEVKNCQFNRNVVVGTATRKRTLVIFGGVGTFAGDVYFENNMFLSDRQVNDNATLVNIATNGSGTFVKNIAEGAYQGIGVVQSGSASTATFSVTDSFFLQDAFCLGQGAVFASYGYTTAQRNIVVTDTSDDDVTSLFTYNTNAGMTADNNTMIRPGPTSKGTALTYGEGVDDTLAAKNNKGRNNIIVGALRGVVDGNTGRFITFTVDTPPGAGIHHNNTYNCGTAYYSDGGTGFTDGANSHPSAVYGDLSLEPQFVDATRRVKAYDKLQGGAGTYDNVALELAKRSGQRGTFNTAYTIETIRQWIFAGFKPQHPLLRGTAYNGADFGAVALDAAIVRTAASSRVAASNRLPAATRTAAVARAGVVISAPDNSGEIITPPPSTTGTPIGPGFFMFITN